MAPATAAAAGVMSSADVGALVTLAAGGSVRAIARLLSYVEFGPDKARAVSAALVGRPRSAAVVGLTGPPGVGKSTITTALISAARSTGQRVAVLAVDPSSALTGGALLGDRVRMTEHTTDPGVFIRSMSSRGHLGGLSAAAPAALDLLSCLGFDLILLETVGVGQNEVDVMSLADTVLVMTAPGAGDAIQAAKAGILEIADVLVVNKADREGAAATVRELKQTVALGRAGAGGTWRVPVLTTVALTGSGVSELTAAIAAHRAHQQASGRDLVRQRSRSALALRMIVLERLSELLSSASALDVITQLSATLDDPGTDRYQAAHALWRWAMGRASGEVAGGLTDLR